MDLKSQRRFVTEIDTDEGKFRLRAISISESSPESLSVLNSVFDELGVVRTPIQIEHLPLATVSMHATSSPDSREKSISSNRFPLPPTWDSQSVEAMFDPFGLEITSLVGDLLNRGLIVAELSPPRLRRLVTIDAIHFYVLSGTKFFHENEAAVVVLLVLEGIYVVLSVFGVIDGARSAVSRNVDEIVDEFIRRKRKKP